MSMPILRPTIAEVDLKKLARNMRKVHEQAGPGVKVLTVLKANAYGHGAEKLGLFLQQRQLSDFFGTASVEEGMALRQAGVEFYGGVSGSADQAVEALLGGTLAYQPNVMCSHHGEGHTCGHGEGHACGGHGCHQG